MDHCIVLGAGAQANRPYEFVLRTVLQEGHPPAQAATVMTPEEYEVVYRVVSRICREFQRQQAIIEGN